LLLLSSFVDKVLIFAHVLSYRTLLVGKMVAFSTTTKLCLISYHSA
jgi:hypothetical protein